MLVTCVAYQNGRRLADIPLEAVKEYTREHPDTFVWVAIKDPAPGEVEALQEKFDLHTLAIDDARHGHQRAKIDEYGHSLFIVLRIMEMSDLELLNGEVSVFIGAQHVISIRRGTKLGFADVRHRCEEEPDLLRNGPVFVLYALMDAVVDRYFPVVEALSAEIEGIEQRIFAGRTTRTQIEALYGMKCKLLEVDHAARAMLEVTSKLHGGRVPQICTGMQEYFRDVHDHLLRLSHSIEGLGAMVTTGISVNLSLIALQQGETTKQLAAYAALAAVPTLIAGVYGMNFEHMPELSWLTGYPMALGLMAGVDAILFWKFRKTGWL